MKKNTRFQYAPEYRARYARQLSLPELGECGQARLAVTSVLIVGAGGLGSAAAFYAAAAGIGRLGIADGDKVELGNLQRQILHTFADVGLAKVESARRRLSALNPDTRLELVPTFIGAKNGEKLFRAYDFVIDATDNARSKFLIAAICHRLGKPYSHAGVDRFMGQTMTVLPGRTACCRCVFDGAVPAASGGEPRGPVGFIPGVIGALQAAEAVKYAAGIGSLLTDCVLVFNGLDSSFRRVTVRKNPHCPLCSARAKSRA